MVKGYTDGRKVSSERVKGLVITIDILKVIQHSLDLNSRDHAFLLARCFPCFFGFFLCRCITSDLPLTLVSIWSLVMCMLMHRMGYDIYSVCGLGQQRHLPAGCHC